MIDFKENIAQKISEVTNIDKEELKTYIEIPPNSDLGDYAFPCFKLAKSLRKAPPVIASEIKEAIKLDDRSITCRNCFKRSCSTAGKIWVK